MANAVRILPVVIAVGIGAVAFKSIDIYQAVAQAVGEGEAPRPETALTAGVGDHAATTPAAGEPATPGAEPAPPAAPKSDVCLPSLDYTAETGISEQEILVLRSLSDRRKALDEREAGIETREQAAAAAESRLQDQIKELKGVETQVQALLTSMNAQSDKRMQDLVKTYEGMKPAQAATIFNTMDEKVLIDLAKSMKPATLGPILAAMNVARAEALTRSLAGLAKPPANLDSLPKSASPQALSPQKPSPT